MLPHQPEPRNAGASAPARTEKRGGTSVSWTIERRGRVAVVTMTTNPVNAQNRAFFADLHEAFDRLERDHAESPVVRGRLTAGRVIASRGRPLVSSPKNATTTTATSATAPTRV